MEVDLRNDNNHRPIYISARLSPTFENELIHLLNECKYCFTWSYDDLSNLDQELIVHKVPIKSGYQPHIQPPRRMSRDLDKLA